MDMLLNFMKIFFLLSIPQAYLHLRLAFAIWGIKLQQQNKKLLIFAVVSSLFLNLDILHVPTEIHIVTATLLYLVIMYFVFRSFGVKKILIIYFTYMFLIIAMEMLNILLIQLIYGLEPNKEMLINQLPELLSISIPAGILLFLLAKMIDKRSFLFFHQLYQYLMNFKQSRKKEILLLTFFQAFLLILLFIINLDDKHGHTKQAFSFIFYTLIVVTLCAFIFTLRLLKRTREEAVRQTQDVYLEEINKMFTTIRGQRHDFLNHVQVMFTMLKMNKHVQLQSYMDDLVKEVHSVNEVILHSSPAIAAFIQAKREMAVTRAIAFTHKLSQTLDIESSIKAIDLIKIMGNLVDNAFEESDTLPLELRSVELILQEENGTINIEVTNQGRLLSDADKEKMLIPGYTTKKIGHSGLGLAIVHERTLFYKGTITIHSSEQQGTVISISLPSVTKKLKAVSGN